MYLLIYEQNKNYESRGYSTSIEYKTKITTILFPHTSKIAVLQAIRDKYIPIIDNWELGDYDEEQNENEYNFAKNIIKGIEGENLVYSIYEDKYIEKDFCVRIKEINFEEPLQLDTIKYSFDSCSH